ncbi:CGNR zinc finger domain-containing protein [Streptomyces spinosirectus]|jgi:predicted RNA-binding Zn ribbon-like protein|uniref:CGNR zinc finger domain-containing protein n=1 Tax=Streptomyces TaxID=1883 RepID=UPI000D34D98B|nr:MULTISPECIES: CGNR zinc finger domain-containing protein [Streptomyces]MBY8345022.1 CGNR zinc finger domain-containing protein [Streptomyces plumbidurans]PTM88293.1 putative RNA-binding Zn ribbon-like protein [Streptomyces sp. VMFN-G11Ma]UIR18223.1 CGNR zinc finger domain-containing protein [Streptomyces spinosirectus]
MPTAPDPRPLTGEPLALDLLNTRWNREGVAQDLLTDTDGLAVWLTANGLDGRFEADATTLRHTLQARDALKKAVDGSVAEGADAVDAVLAHGRIRLTLTSGGPGELPEFDDPSWGAAWLAARNYLELLSAAPDRIRACSGHACVLHFYDTSRNGTRRWCSMASCGNRAKASRHYARSKAS